MDTTTQSKLSADALSAFLRELNAAVRKLGIYPSGHPASVRAAEKPYSMLQELLQAGERIILAVAEGKLIGNGVPLDDRLLLEGLGKVIYESGLASVSLEPGLTPDEFEKFLRQLNVKKEQRNLQAFIETEQIKGISIGKVQYQLVGEDERVVSADMANNVGTGGVSNDMQVTMAEALRSHPALLLQLLGRRKGGGGPGDGSGSGFGDSGGVRGEMGAGSRSGFGFGWNKGGTGDAGSGSQTAVGESGMVANGNGTAPIPMKPDDAGIAKELSAFSNDELLGLLVAALHESLGDRMLSNRYEISQTLFSLKDLLAEREAFDLMPRLKESLGNLNMVDPKYLELIFAADSSPRKVAHTEIQSFKNDFASGSISPERLVELQGWLETINDRQYTEEVVKSLFDNLEQRHFEATESQRVTMRELATLSAQQLDSAMAEAQLRLVKDRLADPSLNASEFVLLADQLLVFYLKFLELEQYGEANTLLELVCQKVDYEIVYADGVTEQADHIYQRMTSAKIAESLMGKLGRNFEGLSKSMTPLLERFTATEAILVFLSYVAHDNRGMRVLLIRLLSGFGQRAIAAFRLALSDRTLTMRPGGQHELAQESWYRIRNIIFILGNIKHADAVALVRQFCDDRDTRVVTECLSALERLGGDEAALLSARILSHPHRDIQLRALHNLVSTGSPTYYPSVEEYFVRNVEERPNSMPALIKLDRQRACNFLASVLLGESEVYNKYHSKPDEELNETIVRTFIQLRSVIFDDVLRKYVKDHTRSLFGQFRKPNSVKTAEKYLRTTSSGL